MTEILNIQGLSAGYGPLRVIHDLDLIIKSGERVGLVGLNGHGKTTLFYAIAGLTGWQRGSIVFNGKQIGRTRSQGPGRYTHQIVRLGLAIMPQGDEIFNGLTVEEHLDSGAFTKEAWRTRSQRKERILDLFEPLRKLLKTPVGQLSGGERRMVSIGRGLMIDAKLYLADEPSLGLAPRIVTEIFSVITRLNESGMTVLLIEQNVKLSLSIANRGIVLENGRVALADSGKALLANDHTRRAYLGM